MARPASHIEAAHIVQRLLRRAQPGAQSTSVSTRITIAEQLAIAIWKRWQVGPWQWQLKHIAWYLEVAIKDSAPTTRYHHWRALRAVLHALGKSHLVMRLSHRQGPASNFLRPDGKIGALQSTGRPTLLPGKGRQR